MNTSSLLTHDDLMQGLGSDGDFAKEYRKLKPYFDLAKEIFEWRKSRHLTQAQLAQESGTHQSRISKIESADLDIRLSTLIDVAEALNCWVDIRLVGVLEDSTYQKIFAHRAQAAPTASYTDKSQALGGIVSLASS